VTTLLGRVARGLPKARLGAALEDLTRRLEKQGRTLERLVRRTDTLEKRLGARLEEADRNAADRAKRAEQAIKHLRREIVREGRRHPAALAPDAFRELVALVREDDRTLLDTDRLYTLWQAAANAAPLGLPAVEAGTFRGGSAYFLAAALRYHAGEERELLTIDTFSGHAEADVAPEEAAQHPPGHFGEADLEDVRAFLSPFARVRVHPARFPEGASEYLPAGALAFAHLDMDLHRPTLASLALLEDRMAPGGVIVVDDFGAPKTPGIRRAVEEFLAGTDRFQAWDVDTEQLLLIRR